MMLGVLILAGAKARVPLLWCNGLWVLWAGSCWGVWVSFCFWVLRVFFIFFFLFHVLVSFLYTSCMLRGTFTLFNKFIYLPIKKKKKKIIAPLVDVVPNI
jgi:hypothetical protein